MASGTDISANPKSPMIRVIKEPVCNYNIIIQGEQGYEPDKYT